MATAPGPEVLRRKTCVYQRHMRNKSPRGSQKLTSHLPAALLSPTTPGHPTHSKNREHHGAYSLTPPSHPLYHFYQHARATQPQAHRSPLHPYFQSPTAEFFSEFVDIQQPDPSIPLQATPNFKTLIITDKERAICSIQCLKPSDTQVLVFSDGL